MAGGRPRIHDRNKILKDLIDWAKKDSSLNINEFCAWYCNPPIGPKKLSEWSKDDDEFRESYDACKAFIAHRRENALQTGKLHVKAYDICAPAYDYIIYEQQLNYELFKAKLKQEEQSTISSEQNQKFDALMSQLSSLQSNSNQVTTKSNKEDKS